MMGIRNTYKVVYMYIYDLSKEEKMCSKAYKEVNKFRLITEHIVSQWVSM